MQVILEYDWIPEAPSPSGFPRYKEMPIKMVDGYVVLQGHRIIR